MEEYLKKINRRKIAVCGCGMVGNALSKILTDAILYDPPKGIGSELELNRADYIFICVPTPVGANGECDTSLVEGVVGLLQGEKVVIIKSTVIPGTTEKLQKKYPQHKFLFNPEFLTEATADQDMCYPDRQLVGYTKESFEIAGDIMMMLPLAPFERILPATEAEMVKYFGNTWFATKVIFANQMYDLCEKIGADYEIVKDCVAPDKRIGRSHLEIFHKGKRGYGEVPYSKCLPKDTRALIAFSESIGVEQSLLKLVDKINKELWEKTKDGYFKKQKENL